MNKSSSVPTPDPNEIAENLRRQAIERLNHDFGPRPELQPEEDQLSEEEHEQSPDIPDESFFSSKKSQLGKARLWLWPCAALGLAFSTFNSKGGSGAFLVSLIATIIVVGMIDWFFLRRLNIGKASVILGQEAIESPIFSGNLKRYQWKDIVGVTLVSDQGGKRLRFDLSDLCGQPDKRNFWTGINYAHPEIPLALFEAQDQENLMGAVIGRLKRNRRNKSAETARLLLNSLTEEREFQERLKSLAPVPWITYVIVAINVLVWLLTLANGASILNAPAERLLAWGGNAASEVQRGEWWRLVTATFLHSGMMHIVMNMIGLVSAGITVERIYGYRLFTLVYLASGLIGSALSLHFSAQHAVSVGASGAVFGVTGALLVAVFQHREKLPKAFGKQTLSSIAFFIVYSLIQGFASKGIDNAAHVGGLISGCLLAFVLPERFDMEHFVRNLKTRAIAGIVITFFVTGGLATLAPAASVDQKTRVEGNAAFLRGMAGFDAAIKALQKEQADIQAGKMTERESDERSRTVHSPVFKRVLHDFSLAALAPSDPRQAILRETKRITELMVESLDMPSVFVEGSDKPEPADPERMKAIEEQLKESGERLQKVTKDTLAQQKR